MSAFDFSFLEKKTDENGLVDNKKSKDISFRKKNGRIIVTNGGKSVGGSRELYDRINEMKTEIRTAEAGHTVTTMKDLGARGTEFKRHGVKSTFPGWFGRLGFNSKADFNKVVEKKSGTRWDRLVKKATKDLSNGYNTTFGRVPANKDFLVKSKQKYDNNGVVFRTIDGKVRPIKTSRSFARKPKYSDEVPF